MYVHTHIQISTSSIVLPSEGMCNPGAPFTDIYEHHEKIFVVAESDDTYVYHLHLGTITLFLCTFLDSVIIH